MLKKFLFWLIGLVILIFLIIRFGTPYYVEQKLHTYLSAVDSASYSFLDVDVWGGNAIIKDFFLADTSGAIAKEPIFLQFDYASIEGLDLWRVIQKRELTANQVAIGKGAVMLSIPEKDSSQTDEANPSKFHSIEIGKLSLDDLELELTLDNQDTNARFNSKVHLEASKLTIPLDTNSPFSYETIALNLGNLYLQPHKSIAYFKIDSIQFNSDAEKLTVNGVKMNQRISKERYASHFGYDKDFITAEVYRIEIFGIPHDIQSLSSGIHLPFLSVLNPQVAIYKDRRLPHLMYTRPFPIEAFSKLPIPLFIDRVDIIDGQLYFDENWRDDYVPGQLYLSDIQAKFSNLSNRGATALGMWTDIEADIEFYQKLKVKVDWRFDLRKNGKAFTLDLDIGSSPLAVLNPFTENTVGLQFKSGYLSGGKLHVEADKNSGAGTLDFYYEKMKVRFLNRENHHQNIIEWAGGGLVNLGIRNNNKPGKKARQGLVFAEPKPERAIFGYVTRMFFSGFKDIAIGSNNNKKAAERGFEYLEDINLED